ncbi:MAG: putative cupin superfamily protein [Myxococcota bacterium]|jgi:uncharacterized cupin superfamily protein
MEGRLPQSYRLLMKPIINLDALTLHEDPDDGTRYGGGGYGVISDEIGAKKLGYNLSIVPPGRRGCPFHSHRNQEEMFFILSGTGVLRFGDTEHSLRPNDVIACPPGGPEVAHQIINTGTEDLRYLAVSTKEPVEIVEYPDSGKVGCFVGDYGKMALRKLFRAEGSVPYMDREPAGLEE